LDALSANGPDDRVGLCPAGGGERRAGAGGRRSGGRGRGGGSAVRSTNRPRSTRRGSGRLDERGGGAGVAAPRSQAGEFRRDADGIYVDIDRILRFDRVPAGHDDCDRHTPTHATFQYRAVPLREPSFGEGETPQTIVFI